MSTGNIKKKFLGSKVRPVRGADNLTAIYEPVVWTMWDPQHLTTLQALTVCYEDSFTFYCYACSVGQLTHLRFVLEQRLRQAETVCWELFQTRIT
jgi:hypothetical protein